MTNKNFLKLKQSDRIEYLLRKREIDDDCHYDTLLRTCWLIIFLFGICMVADLYLSQSSKSMDIITNVFGNNLWVFYVCLGISFILDIYNVYSWRKQINELDEEFFETKSKK